MTKKFEVNGWLMTVVSLLIAGSLALNVDFIRSIPKENRERVEKLEVAVAEGVKWMQTHTKESEQRLTALETKVDALD